MKCPECQSENREGILFMPERVRVRVKETRSEMPEMPN